MTSRDDPNDLVPDEIEEGLNVVTLTAGGIVGAGALTQLVIDTLEGRDLTGALKEQFGINQLEDAFEEMDKNGR
jgi:hypothetical protein